MRYPNARYDLPQVLAAGVSWSDPERGLRVNADFESPRHYYNSVRVGGEWTWRERVAMRAGYRLALGAPSDATTSGPAFGVGAGVGTMWMDYAFLLDGGSTGGEHRIGLTFRPGFLNMGAAGGTVRAERFIPETVAVPKPAAATAGTAKAAARPGTGEPVRSTGPASSAPRAETTATAPRAGASAPPLSARPTWVVVAPGETLASIAQRWGTTVAAIMEANNLVSDRVAPGKQLKLPSR
jgi:LysM repeat protein